ncbi:monovalent cation/H+ antiporter subunit D [Pseudogemmobacter blasticus]|uniref:Monovalent cation/H+ antiporter subunit D n=1 Tax=Fuscovulum blasticum DSM 2131 TaxID=1188250 RepID=A0A2T4J8I6_FUSBL|nr:monovalent cation/H+ antiporter subunit D [Fuscovulum blasticum]PTE14137.1 monovalent cation/H+ antiporter subunit D [Fuscovulum blasticum DSM 2131]
MTGDWIIAPVVLPAALAGLALLFARRNLGLARGISLAGTGALLALAIWAVATTGDPQVYRLGNWPAPFGIVLVLDGLSALMLLLTAGLALTVLVQAVTTGRDRKGPHFHALWLFQVMGLNGAFLTGDAFNLFVFFEVLLIASYGLMVHGGGAGRYRAGIAYIAVNLVGSTLFLFALATVYAVMGTLNMADLAVKLAELPPGDQALMRLAAVLLLMVFAVKGALVPLQVWLPGTYANAPGVVAALFAVMTKVGAYAAIRFGTLVFPPGNAATGNILSDLILPAAVLTMAVGGLGVLASRGVARVAGYAAIASMGTAFVAIAGFTAPGLGAALYYIAHSTFAGALLFLVSDLVTARKRGARLPGGLAALFLVAAVAVAGLPPLSGFVGKLFVMQATADHAALIWSAVLGTSFLLVLGLSRCGSRLFWKADDAPAPRLSAGELVGPLWLTATLVGMTVWAAPIRAHLDGIVAGLLNPAAIIAANTLGAVP